MNKSNQKNEKNGINKILRKKVFFASSVLMLLIGTCSSVLAQYVSSPPPLSQSQLRALRKALSTLPSQQNQLIQSGMIMPAKNTVHVVWDKVPINFVIPVGSERMLSFPGRIDFHNKNPELTSDKVAVLNNNGTLYIKAKKAFSPIRVPIILNKDGEAILVDISAKPNADDSPMTVILSSETNSTNVQNNVPEKATQTPPVSVGYTTLMRYAIQQLYAPDRLVQDTMSINRTPMYTSKSVDLIYGDNVISMPLISWRGGNLYVTAVLVKNIWNHNVSLDPRALRGRWVAASFYPTNYLTKQGSLHDRTTLFVISSQPFNDALNNMRGYV